MVELCTLCNECLPCPEKINIPEVLRFRNLLQAYDMEDYGKFRYNMFESEGHWFPGNFASKCTECGDCLPRCPERLEIPKLLFDTHHRLFDRKAWLKNKLLYFAYGIYRFFRKFAVGIDWRILQYLNCYVLDKKQIFKNYPLNRKFVLVYGWGLC